MQLFVYWGFRARRQMRCNDNYEIIQLQNRFTQIIDTSEQIPKKDDNTNYKTNFTDQDSHTPIQTPIARLNPYGSV